MRLEGRLWAASRHQPYQLFRGFEPHVDRFISGLVVVDDDRDLLVLLRGHGSDGDGLAGAGDLCLVGDGEYPVGHLFRLWIDDGNFQFAHVTAASVRLRVLLGLQRNHGPVVGDFVRKDERRENHETYSREKCQRCASD